ncbi:sigma factor-like helix-turn-helix DNA-binding protein [Nannocystis pusilla]|uniref:sigma factor-like helix-turn-helix DNA-binding protein n=1 Tax=Nannocystis pusilla TaxID=889268 RepID=UPI003B7EC0F4
MFAQLTPLEADILRKRVGLDGETEMTLKDIGAGYSLSRERIRQLQEGALAKLRAEFSRRKLM